MPRTFHSDLNVPFDQELGYIRYRLFHSKFEARANPLVLDLSFLHTPSHCHCHSRRWLKKMWSRDLL